MNEIIEKIEIKIWNSVIEETKIGILQGLSGVALFYNYLYEVYAKEDYHNKLLIIIEKINKIVEEDYTPTTFCSGIAGYGFLLLRLKNNSLEIDDEYFESIDLILLEDFDEMCAENKYDFLHGAMGIAMYYIERYKINKSTKIIEILDKFSGDLITKIETNFEELLISKTSIDDGNCYYFGLAHGVASYLNFLTYLASNFKELKQDISKSLRVCLTFLDLYKNKDLSPKHYYPNLYLFNSNSATKARLAWCQGDSGISNSFYNSGMFLNDESLKNAAIEIMNNTKKLQFEETGVEDFAICHGSIGVLIQYHLASIKYNVDYSKQIELWFDVVREQTDDFNQFFIYEQNELIEEINVLDGLAGLGLSILTLDKKISLEWLEILNLH